MIRNDKHIPVHVGNLTDGYHEDRFHVQPVDLELPACFDESIAVGVMIDKSHSQIMIRIDLQTSATHPCDRCFDPVVIPVDQSFTLVYVHSDETARSFDDDDVRVLDESDPVVDLSEDVRDFAMLSLPMRITCGEDDEGKSACRSGPPASFFSGGIDRVDPRWDALRALQSKENTVKK